MRLLRQLLNLMKMRCLFLIVASLAVAGVASVGQVFSVNIVGYINLQLTPGLNLLVNQLAATTDDLNSFMPAVPDGTVVFRFDPVTQSYLDGVTFLDGVGWYPASGAKGDSVKSIPLGEGFFVQIPGSTNFLVTFVGEVRLDSTNRIPGNYSLKGSILPLSGPLVVNLGFRAADGDLVYQWDAVLQSFKSAAAYSIGNWQPEEPTIAIGEGFMLFRDPVQATPDNWWIRHFAIGPAVGAATPTAPSDATAPAIQRLVLPTGNARLDIRNPNGEAYDVQFSSDASTWKTVATHQLSTQWTAPFTSGSRGYFRLTKSSY